MADTITKENSEEKDCTNKEPYQQAYYPPVPTGFTRWFRTSIIWQIYRFIVINYKMMKLMAKSEH